MRIGVRPKSLRLRARAAAAALCLCAVPASAQSVEDPAQLRREIAEERGRLEAQRRQLEEQVRRLDQLEARLEAAIESQEKPPGERETGAASEQARVVPERLEKGPNQSKDSHDVMNGAELVADDFVGSWPMFGSEYRMKIGGYFKLDALYDFDGAGDPLQFPIGQIPVDGSPEAGRSGYFNMFVRETRVNLDVRRRGPGGTAQQVFLEGDFFDESSNAPRLRHAYLVYGNLLVGQAWTTVLELDSVPFTIDFGSGDALFGTRTPQIRWQQQTAAWSWALGLEKQQTAGIYNPLGLPGSASTQWPVLAGRLTHERTNGKRTLAVLVQGLHWDGAGAGPDADAVGWALIYGGRQNVGRRDFFTWNFAYGDGTADNIMALTGSEANAVLTPDGRLVTRRGYSAALGFGHQWTERLSSNLAYAFTDLEDIGQRAPDAIQSGGVGHFNLVWSPKEKLTTGLELIWGRRENADGDKGKATRVQTMVKYLF